MPQTNPDKPLCANCGKRNAQPDLKGKCRACHEAEKALENLPEALRNARKQKDWVKLAEDLSGTYAGIASGDIKASAAQARILTTIWDRAYGKPSKTQDDVLPAHGIVVLPTLGFREKMHACPNCGIEFGIAEVTPDGKWIIDSRKKDDVSNPVVPVQSE